MNQHLVLTDFDGTLANTFQDSPRGMNVQKASMLGIYSIFGEKGVISFNDIGGLQNREPGELVGAIQKITGRYEIPKDEAIKMFVRAKLDHLVPEISPEWPQFYPGAIDFLKKATEGGYFTDVGILSSGHDEFITRALDVNGVDSSKLIIVTSDVLRERPMPERPRYKPHSYQFAEAHKRWLETHGALPQSDDPNSRESYAGRAFGKPNILYIGDDPIKDGGLASEARVPFLFVPNTKEGFEPDGNKAQLLLPDFTVLDDILDYQHGDELAKGRTFSKALFDRRDEELFPPVPDGELYQSMMRGERSFV